MPFLPRKGILAIAAVVDIALNDRDHPVSAKTLATRHGLPPRHLEPVLQALVREGILRGIRGPGGGYRRVDPAGHRGEHAQSSHRIRAYAPGARAGPHALTTLAACRTRSRC